MRKASYDLKQVICPNASCIGYSSNVAKPGYWISWGEHYQVGRVLGRIAKTEGNPDCKGYLAVMELEPCNGYAFMRWVSPNDVRLCYDDPPAKLFAWITGDDWVKNKGDIARMIAMSEFGTLSEQFIETRDDPTKDYNCRPEYVKQFLLED